MHIYQCFEKLQPAYTYIDDHRSQYVVLEANRNSGATWVLCVMPVLAALAWLPAYAHEIEYGPLDVWIEATNLMRDIYGYHSLWMVTTNVTNTDAEPLSVNIEFLGLDDGSFEPNICSVNGGVKLDPGQAKSVTGCFLVAHSQNPVLIGVGGQYGEPHPVSVLPFASGVCEQATLVGASCQKAQAELLLPNNTNFDWAYADVQYDTLWGPDLVYATYDIDSNSLVIAFDRPIWWGNDWNKLIQLHAVNYHIRDLSYWLSGWDESQITFDTPNTHTTMMSSWLGEWDDTQIFANVIVSKAPNFLREAMLSDTVAFLGVSAWNGTLVDADGIPNEFDIVHVAIRDTPFSSDSATDQQDVMADDQDVYVIEALPPDDISGTEAPEQTGVHDQTVHTIEAAPSCPNTGVAEQTEHDSATEWKTYMLDIINAERQNVGLDPVVLGNNPVAQVHADNMLDACFASHWGTDGLKPYMRYSLNGGYQNNAENTSGLDYCIKPHENYVKISPKQDIQESMSGFMSSPGHRDNILDPHHSTVNLGIAWDDHNMMVAQHFEYGYACFEDLPVIQDGVLSFSAVAQKGAIFSDNVIQLHYDPPPRDLTRGQLARTYCYDNGLTIAAFVPPPPPGAYYTTDSYHSVEDRCPDPYNIPPNASAPGSVQEAYDVYQDAYNSARLLSPYVTTVPYIEADRWSHTGDRLSMSANIERLLQEHGPGVYTLTVWGVAKGEDVPLSTYSLFYLTDAPPGYRP